MKYSVLFLLIFTTGIILMINNSNVNFVQAKPDIINEDDISLIKSKTGNQRNFNIAVASDWGCNPNAKTTSQNIQNHNPELVVIAGDLSYKPSGECWFQQISPLASKIKLALGDHDYGDTVGGIEAVTAQYLKPFGIEKTYYSVDLNNVHVTFMDAYTDYTPGTVQHQFIENDLKNAFNNPKIDWTIVVEPVPIFTSPSKHPSDLSIRNIYQPLFDKYGVDIVLSGDNHNYQRTFPLKYNPIGVNTDQPLISNQNKNNYGMDDGVIYIITGTAGRGLYELTGQSPFVSIQDDKHFGFLNIEVNVKSLKGTFIANPAPKLTPIGSNKGNHNNNVILDEFSISEESEKTVGKPKKSL